MRKPKRTAGSETRPVRRRVAAASRSAAPSSERSGERPASRHDQQIQENVRRIAAMEHDALARRPAVARVSDRIASFAGSGTFVLLHVVWFATWVLWNSGWFGLHRFDPYPFTFLTFIVSLEAIFLSTFVLISQNRMSQQSELRSHLDLQINLLAEQESTKTLRILLRVCERLGIDTDDEEMRQLMRETQPSQIVSDMTKHLPGEDS